MQRRCKIIGVCCPQAWLSGWTCALLVVAVSVCLGALAQQDDAALSTEAAPVSEAEEIEVPGETLQPPAEPEVEDVPFAAVSDAPALLYMTKCIGCHTLGGGALTGPDLAPTLGWPSENLVTGIVRMEEKVGPLSAEEVDQLVAFLQSGNAQERLIAERERVALAEAATLEPGSASIGGQLFTGQIALQNRGLACAACHQASGYGGNFAPDLTGIYEELGAPSLQSACEGTNFPVMREAYEDHSVTKQEARHLVAYFEEIAGKDEAGSTAPLALIVQVLGVVGCVAVFGLVGVVHVKRGTGVRRNLIKQSMKGETR